METLLLYALCTASLFYLGSRAVITSWLWSRYPAKLGHFFDCSACSGTWYGALVGYVGGYHFGLSFLGLPGDRPETVVAVALCAMAFTPIAAGLVQAGFDKLGVAVIEPEAEVVEKTVEPAPEPTPIGERTSVVLPTVFAENPAARAELQREISGTITTRDTPREIPLRVVVIPPKHRISTLYSGYACSCGARFPVPTDHTLDEATNISRLAHKHADEENDRDGSPRPR